MSRRLLVIAAIVAASCRGSSPDAPRPGEGPGALGPAGAADPTAPGLRLPAGFTPTRYRARLAIDPAQPDFAGAIEIEGTLAAPAKLIWLHAEELRIDRAVARAGGKEIALEPVVERDRVALRARGELPAGPVVLALDYQGTFAVHDTYGAFAQEAKGDRYVFTQLEPTGARRIFPSVDEPWSKVPWQLTLDVPAGVTALGNAPVAREEPLEPGTRVVFAETQPLPTYLIAFAVGPFELVDGGTTRGGAPIRIATPRGRAAEAKWAAEVTGKIVTVLEDWFGTPYPYEKLDSVVIPVTSGFGAMENAGLITYRETRILIPPDDKGEDARRAYVVLAAHEIAHQWFGDLVTPAWWDDLWLNEAFANWMEEKAMASFSPAWGLRIPAVVERDRALTADGLVSARRLRQPIDREDDIATAFDRITYDKGAAVIRMFEAWVGADTFQAGIRAYLAEHAGGVATSADFLAAIDAASDLEVAPAFTGFLDQVGAPRVGATLRCEDKKKGPAVVTLTQERWLPRGSAPPAGEPAPSWRIPVCVAYGAVKTRQEACTVLAAPSAELTLEGRCPSWFLPNSNGKGYYRMGLSREALDDLLDDGWKQLRPHERILVAGDVRAAVNRGELEIGAELALVSRLVRDGSRHAIEMAVTIARDALEVASETARPALVEWVGKTFGPRARKLGFLPDKGDGLDEEVIRAALLPLAVEIGGEKKLVARAVELARDWRELPPSARATVLRAAVQTSAEVRAALRAAALAPTDDREARDVFEALGALLDPDEARAALEVLLDPAVDLKQGRHLLYGLADDPRTQPVAEAFLREHVAALLPRMAEGSGPDLIDVITASCDAGKRADAAAWAKQHVEPLEGGLRTSAQSLEQMDLCIARRAAMGPELDTWLEGRK